MPRMLQIRVDQHSPFFCLLIRHLPRTDDRTLVALLFAFAMLASKRFDVATVRTGNAGMHQDVPLTPVVIQSVRVLEAKP